MFTRTKKQKDISEERQTLNRIYYLSYQCLFKQTE